MLSDEHFPVRIFQINKAGRFDCAEWIEDSLEDLREAILVLKAENGLKLFYWSEGYCDVINEEQIFEE
jgi:hypothetical protein